MQLGILQLPDAVGLPADKRIQVPAIELFRGTVAERDPYLYRRCGRKEVTLGAKVNRQPTKLFKVFNATRDGSHVFETVFADEGRYWVCLYTKSISQVVNVHISMNGISFYHAQLRRPLTFQNIVRDCWGHESMYLNENDLHSLLPGIYDDRGVRMMFSDLSSIAYDYSDWQTTTPDIKALFDNDPQVLEALIAGRFVTSPVNRIDQPYPGVFIEPERWSLQEIANHSARVRKGTVYTNHPNFDHIVHDVVTMRVSHIDAIFLVEDLIVAVTDITAGKDIRDIYQAVLPTPEDRVINYQFEVHALMREAMELYCQLFAIDPNNFRSERRGNTPPIPGWGEETLPKSEMKSTITLNKNIYDEVLITIHDAIHDRYVLFYGYYPCIALTTRSIATYSGTSL